MVRVTVSRVDEICSNKSIFNPGKGGYYQNAMAMNMNIQPKSKHRFPKVTHTNSKPPHHWALANYGPSNGAPRLTISAQSSLFYQATGGYYQDAMTINVKIT